MDAAELQWWAAAEDLGMVPDPPLATAQLRSTIANSQGARTKPSDFLPAAPGPAETPEEQIARFRAATAGVPRA